MIEWKSHMNLELPISLASRYRSGSQRARVMTEPWVAEQAYCPACGRSLSRCVANKPVADFYCSFCSGEYELKSTKGRYTTFALGGAYESMIARICSINAPSFFFLGHDGSFVHTFFTVPSHFMTPAVVRKRNPLRPTAARSGWVGCSILLNCIPSSGRIFYVQNGIEQDKSLVLEQYAATSFLKNTESPRLRGWLLDVMCCIEKLGKKEFTLEDLYHFEQHLAVLHPQNRNIRPKIRQQLQYLRDMEYLSFLARGKYRLNLPGL